MYCIVFSPLPSWVASLLIFRSRKIYGASTHLLRGRTDFGFTPIQKYPQPLVFCNIIYIITFAYISSIFWLSPIPALGENGPEWKPKCPILTNKILRYTSVKEPFLCHLFARMEWFATNKYCRKWTGGMFIFHLN